MRFFTNLWTTFIGVFRRTHPEPEAGASATLELSRTDIEIVS